MNLRLKVYLFLVSLIGLGAGGYFLYQHYFNGKPVEAVSSDAAKKKAEEDTVPVELSTATLGPISSYLSSTANLRAMREVQVASLTAGVVSTLHVEEGDVVRKGDLLCRLDDSEFQIRLKLTEQRMAQARLQEERAKIRLEQSGVQIKNTRQELDRQETAGKEGLVSEQVVAEVRYRMDDLLHNQRSADSEQREFTHRIAELAAEIQQVKLEISRARITAPFSGHVTERTVELGQTVRNLDGLFKLGTLSPLYADVHLAERDAQSVRPNFEALVSLGSRDSEMVTGRVLRISPVVDDSSGTVKITVELGRAGPGFKPGAFVRVEILTGEREQAVLVPKRSLFEEDNESFVYVGEDNIARKKKVELGYQSDTEVEIRSGVSAGERVVVAGQGNLTDGAKIREVPG